MSNLAAAVGAPLRRGAERLRHLEIVSTAAQRRARPKVVYAVIVVGGIGAILLAQLLLSIATAGGAYRITALQLQQRDYTRQQAALGEKLDVLRSTQNLTRDAEGLGMVASGNPVFLDATSGAVQGTATPAGGSLTGSGNVVGNALLGGAALTAPTAADAAAATGAATSTDPGAGNTGSGNTGSGAAATQDDGGGVSTAGAPVTNRMPVDDAASGTATTGAGTAGASSPGQGTASVASAPGVLASPTTH